MAGGARGWARPEMDTSYLANDSMRLSCQAKLNYHTNSDFLLPLSLSLSLPLSLPFPLPLPYCREKWGHWKGKGGFSCQSWDVLSALQLEFGMHFSIEMLMQTVIEIHQEGRVSVKPTNFEARETTGPWFYHVHAVCPWANNLTYLSFGSLWHRVVRIKSLR